MDDVGIKIHKLRHLRLHAKMMLADETAAVVGSINFANGSLDGRRELAIEVHDDDVVDRLETVARHDWEHSHPLDLSDEGLLSDLEKRLEGTAEMLAIDTKRDHAGE
jgi:phosphatidylserine/phosphatidylglycerophosphate/cardiolipin synthase-like enzyme